MRSLQSEDHDRSRIARGKYRTGGQYPVIFVVFANAKPLAAVEAGGVLGL